MPHFDRDRLGYRKPELRANAEARVFFRCVFDNDAKGSPFTRRQCRYDATAEGERPFGQRSARRPVVARLRSHRQSGPIDHHADAAELTDGYSGPAVDARPALEARGRQAQEAEVQSARGGDTRHPALPANTCST
jgi:hypothetical protein